MSYVKLGETVRIVISTSNSSGAAANADSTPTVTVYQQGTAMGYAPTVTNKSTGEYEVAIVCSGGNGFASGKEYSASVSATVGGVTGKDGIASFFVVATNNDDIPTAAAIGAQILATALEGTETVGDAIRLLTSVAAGAIPSGLDATLTGSPLFKSKDGSKTRVAGSVAGGARTISTRDGT
jgi:hypothetical protein